MWKTFVWWGQAHARYDLILLPYPSKTYIYCVRKCTVCARSHQSKQSWYPYEYSCIQYTHVIHKFLKPETLFKLPFRKRASRPRWSLATKMTLSRSAWSLVICAKILNVLDCSLSRIINNLEILAEVMQVLLGVMVDPGQSRLIEPIKFVHPKQPEQPLRKGNSNNI